MSGTTVSHLCASQLACFSTKLFSFKSSRRCALHTTRYRIPVIDASFAGSRCYFSFLLSTVGFSSTVLFSTFLFSAIVLSICHPIFSFPCFLCQHFSRWRAGLRASHMLRHYATSSREGDSLRVREGAQLPWTEGGADDLAPDR